MKVVLSALFYPFTMAHFFWRALERREDVDLFVLGAFTDTWIPWNGGIHLPRKYVKTPDLPLPSNMQNSGISYKIIEGLLPEKFKNPDLWLQVDAGWHFKDKPKADVTALVKTDPHAIPEAHYFVPSNYSDFVFGMQTPYLKPGEFYFPYAYDPEIHYPEDRPKEYDVCVVGLGYKERLDVLNRCKKNGLSIYYSIGEVYDEYRERYARSKIAFNWSSLLDLPTRIFEYAAMGIPMVTNRVPDLSTFFVERDHYLGADSVDEAVENIMFLANNESFANEMAQSAKRKVQHHSWDNRITQLLETCKLI